jgi:hypothetical protein
MLEDMRQITFITAAILLLTINPSFAQVDTIVVSQDAQMEKDAVYKVMYNDDHYETGEARNGNRVGTWFAVSSSSLKKRYSYADGKCIKVESYWSKLSEYKVSYDLNKTQEMITEYNYTGRGDISSLSYYVGFTAGEYDTLHLFTGEMFKQNHAPLKREFFYFAIKRFLGNTILCKETLTDSKGNLCSSKFYHYSGKRKQLKLETDHNGSILFGNSKIQERYCTPFPGEPIR